MDKLRGWQKKVINDDSEEVLVLKGRQVGATSLLFHIAKQSDSVWYVTLRHSMLNKVKNNIICNIDTSVKCGYQKIEALLSPKVSIEIEFMTINQLQDNYHGKQSDELPEAIIFDEIGKNQLPQSVKSFLLPRIEQKYYFTSPSQMDESVYVVPSIGNSDMGIDTINEIEDMYDHKGFREEISAGVTISEELDEKLVKFFKTQVEEVTEIENNEAEELIKYKGNIYKKQGDED